MSGSQTTEQAFVRITVDATEAARALEELAREWQDRLAAFYAALDMPKPRTRSADRTRSPRWRAGTRRTRRLTRIARAQGRPTPLSDPWKGWTDVGVMDEPDGR